MNEYLFYKFSLFVDLLDCELSLALKKPSCALSCARDALEAVQQLKKIVVEVKQNDFKGYDSIQPC